MESKCGWWAPPPTGPAAPQRRSAADSCCLPHALRTGFSRITAPTGSSRCEGDRRKSRAEAAGRRRCRSPKPRRSNNKTTSSSRRPRAHLPRPWPFNLSSLVDGMTGASTPALCAFNRTVLTPPHAAHRPRQPSSVLGYRAGRSRAASARSRIALSPVIRRRPGVARQLSDCLGRRRAVGPSSDRRPRCAASPAGPGEDIEAACWGIPPWSRTGCRAGRTILAQLEENGSKAAPGQQRCWRTWSPWGRRLRSAA